MSHSDLPRTVRWYAAVPATVPTPAARKCLIFRDFPARRRRTVRWYGRRAHVMRVRARDSGDAEKPYHRTSAFVERRFIGEFQ
jgi:hypothetical protein